jgi:type IV secretion system protein VirB5
LIVILKEFVMRKHYWTVFAAALVSMGLCPASQAQWAVVDVGAITQLLKEVATLEQQLQTAQSTLTNAQQQFQSMVGNRGMQNLLSATNRNYLPSSWSQLTAAVGQTGGAYQALSVGVQSLMVANAVLTPQQVAALSPAEQTQLQTARQSAALLQSTSRQALDNTSARFASLQQLINAIPSAADQKGALDLQARIQAEQAMLQNENTKMVVLHQTLEAQEWARKQSAREQVVAGVGSLRSLPALNLP